MTRRGTLARCAVALVAASLLSSMAQAARLPPPGSYVLNRIQRVPPARLLNAEGKTVDLDAATHGAVTALAFFYGQCRDPQGCPVAWSTFEAARVEASADPLLQSRLRLVFVSLDPERDRPNVIRLLQEGEGRGAIPWVFLTSRSSDDLLPLLAAMGQDVGVERDSSGRRTGGVNHLLKIFLIDPEGVVREIYTTAYLTPENLLNDARTLALAFPKASNGDTP